MGYSHVLPELAMDDIEINNSRNVIDKSNSVPQLYLGYMMNIRSPCTQMQRFLPLTSQSLKQKSIGSSQLLLK